MGKQRIKKWLIITLSFTLLFIGLMPGTLWADTVSPPAIDSDQPTATPSDESPSAAPTESPTASPVPTPRSYVLTSPGAKYKKGGQKGIRYKRVKGKKIYHITSYATDTVTLAMSQPSSFKVYGGTKKQVRQKAVTVNSSGQVKCRRRGRGEKTYTIIEATSRETGEKQYVYIYFKKKMYSKGSVRISLYERYKQQVSFDYGRKKLKFESGNEKTAVVNKKGVITGVKKGTTTITARVKDSVSNLVRIKVIVTVEPWVVSKNDTVYDYEDMVRDLNKLQEKYPSRARLMSIGTTYDKRQIWAIRIGKSSAKKKLVIDAAIHAREWKNTQVMMRQTEEILRDYPDFRNRFQKTCVYIIPMDNPDGVSISQYGFKAIRNKKLQKLCKKIGKPKVWKANARGVDLNDNFAAGFSKKRGKKKPSYMGYPGKKAESERESRALVRFIEDVEPDAVLNVHSMGNVIYWDFNVDGDLYTKQEQLAAKVNSFNEYQLMPKGGSTNAAGGFADWLVYDKGITSITIETGSVYCPLPHSQFKSIYSKNNKMFRWFMTEYVNRVEPEEQEQEQEQPEEAAQ